MPGAYEETYHDINSFIVTLPLDRIDELKQLAEIGYPITPHVEFIMQQCRDFRDGKLKREDLGKEPTRFEAIAELCFQPL